jgi:MraZ protein
MPPTLAGFSGEHFHSLDEKKRLTVPARWRNSVLPKKRKGAGGDADAPGEAAGSPTGPAEEEQSFLAMPNPNGSITVHPPQAVARLKERLSEVSMGDSQSQRVLHAIFAKSEFLKFDAQGRFTLPESLLGHAGLTREAVLVGTVVQFHIWEPARYKATMVEAAPSQEEIAATLRELRL